MNSVLITTLSALFVFGLLITSHELGHFIIAKLSGITVLEFAIGMGPKILSFQKGETKYTLRALPIGGYNKMLGEQEKSDDPKAFSNKSPWKRLGVIVAGSLMNFIIAIVLFFLFTYNIGVPKPVINAVQNNYPAQMAGLQKGDRLVSANGVGIKGHSDFISIVNSNEGKPLDLVVKRGASEIVINVVPILNPEKTKYLIGIEMGYINEKVSIVESAKEGFFMTGDAISQMVGFLNKAIHGKVSSKEVGGPVAIVKMSGQFGEKGIWSLLYFIAFLSINLGVFNLIPFPALDGGWVIILLYEGITRKKIDENKIGFVNFIGFVVLIGLIILLTFKDIFGKSAF